MSPLRAVLVDDHALVRSGVRAVLAPDLVVVGEADDVEGAVAVVAAQAPDVVLLDVHLPGGSGGASGSGGSAGGVEVLRGTAGTLRPDGQPVRFLALSVSDAAEDVIAVVRAGARGYVTKSVDGPALSEAVRRVAAGDAVFSPRLAGFVLDAFGSGAGEVARQMQSSTASPRASGR